MTTSPCRHSPFLSRKELHTACFPFAKLLYVYLFIRDYSIFPCNPHGGVRGLWASAHQAYFPFSSLWFRSEFGSVARKGRLGSSRAVFRHTGGDTCLALTQPMRFYFLSAIWFITSLVQWQGKAGWDVSALYLDILGGTPVRAWRSRCVFISLVPSDL